MTTTNAPLAPIQPDLHPVAENLRRLIEEQGWQSRFKAAISLVRRSGIRECHASPPLAGPKPISPSMSPAASKRGPENISYRDQRSASISASIRPASTAALRLAWSRSIWSA